MTRNHRQAVRDVNIGKEVVEILLTRKYQARTTRRKIATASPPLTGGKKGGDLPCMRWEK